MATNCCNCDWGNFIIGDIEMNSFIDAQDLSKSKDVEKSRTAMKELEEKVKKLEEENKILKEAATKDEVIPPVIPAGAGSVPDPSGSGQK